MGPSNFLRAAARYAAQGLRADLAAGLALAAVALPSQMATAHLAGFPPATGFIAFAAAAIGFSAVGANHFVVACADSTISPVASPRWPQPEAPAILRFARASRSLPEAFLFAAA